MPLPVSLFLGLFALKGQTHNANNENSRQDRKMAEMVRGVILDDSVLFANNQNDDQKPPSLRPGVESLLRKLNYSKIRTGISYGPGVSEDKVTLLKKTAALHSYDCFLLKAFSIDVFSEISKAWENGGGTTLFLVSYRNEDAIKKLCCSWLTIVLDVEGGHSCENSNMIHVKGLEELPLAICHLNRKALGSNILTVGYIMKPSREADFAARGAFPMYPTPNGLIFLPLTFDFPLSSQLKGVDVILHKATDEILSIQPNCSPQSSFGINYTKGMQELQEYMEHHPDCFVIDPLDNIYPVLDRFGIQDILLGLGDLNKADRSSIRGPHFLKVDSSEEPDLLKRLSEAKLSLPSIVKPQIACGVSDAHKMGIIFQVEDFKDLNVPFPAVIQEYVDHSSTLYKFYVLGEQVFHAVKNSTPNADGLRELSRKFGTGPLLFDSLKSLPTGTQSQHSEHEVDIGLVTDAAHWLRRKLDLTIFGFDVVIQEGSGDHVIVDLNYLPSFKEVPDHIAISAFWDAIRMKFESKKMT